MSYKQYKIMDIFLLSFLAMLIEFLGFFLAEKLSSPLYVSFALTIGVVALIRWGLVGIVVYMLAGIPLILLKEQSITISIIYEVLANAALALPFIFLIKKDKDEIYKKKQSLFYIVLASVASLCVAKGVVLSIVFKSLTAFINYFSTSLFMIVINVGFMMILSFSKSQLIRDMDTYIKESQN